MEPSPDVTLLLNKLAAGDQTAAGELVPPIYGELRRLAARHLSHERSDHTLQTTALVHEAYLKLAAQKDAKWQNRAQFFGVASQAMRRILVDYARGKQRIRRGGKQQKVSLDDVSLVSPSRTEEVLAVHESLSRLEALDARQARIVKAALLRRIDGRRNRRSSEKWLGSLRKRPGERYGTVTLTCVVCWIAPEVAVMVTV